MTDTTNDIDAEGEKIELNYDESTSKGESAVKVICLGDTAVGKSKYVNYLKCWKIKPTKHSAILL